MAETPTSTAAPVPYASSPIFDEVSLPDSLRAQHRTKSGTWGLARVLEGSVIMVYDDTAERQTLTPDRPGLLAPDQPHHVEVTGPMKMRIDFFRERPSV
ncbi:MAG: DUF1971 domain-containing protein [Sphingomicrobium sp.]